jgi:hypothetical protein
MIAIDIVEQPLCQLFQLRQERARPVCRSNKQVPNDEVTLELDKEPELEYAQRAAS